MLEPPPSAKPFTNDVDKKLEEGQKVITFLCYQNFYLSPAGMVQLLSI